MKRRSFIASGAAGACGVGRVPSAFAQARSDALLKWVVGFAPGAGSDTVARTIAQFVGRGLDVPVIVENKPGAAGGIAAAAVARAPADGNTVLTVDNAMMTSIPFLYEKIGYDPARSFTPLVMIGTLPFVLAVPAQRGVADAPALFRQLRARSGALSYGSPGIGSPHHLATEMLLESIGATALHVPYKGVAPLVTDLLGGQLDFALLGVAGALPHFRSGGLRPLAIGRAARLPELSRVPTLREAGVEKFDATAWQMVVAPSGTPPPRVTELTAALRKALADPEVRSRLAAMGVELDTEPLLTRAGGLRAYLDGEIGAGRDLIRRRGIKVE
ncbi:tripartite tricarboxylate transporter substrate binding protein [Pigmentiphaga sp. H8]|uniref:Bug family tripartite tricarboxylate transporter substrate binding protein n=1 Tax=Pigmentiphaga sp. H8 TaxID=2488560 RepID=UPI0013760119|nr:tripartite tricarboxylate transporter substrate binding protein [Pigmentiphaga sp. H8]